MRPQAADCVCSLRIGNRTISTAAIGGMLVGTLIGVLVIPGLYYIFARIADGRCLIKDGSSGPLSEGIEHKVGVIADKLGLIKDKTVEPFCGPLEHKA